MKIKTLLAAGLATTTLAAAPAMAQQGTMQSMQADKDKWEQVREQTVSAQDLMGGDVSNGVNMLGDIDQLILDPTQSRLEYVLYDVPYPWSFYGSDDGFVRWDNVEIERGFGTGIDVRIDDDAYDFRKDQLELTRSQAQGRLVDDIISGDVRFSDGTMRGIDDVLFNPDTGAITHFVVEMDGEDLFGNDNRLVPASMVRYDERGDYWMVSQSPNYDWEIWVY